MTGIAHFVVHVLGLDHANGSYYLFWSGVGGNAALIIVAVIYNRFTCDIPGCHQIGLTRQPLTGHSFCRRHDRIGKIEAAATAEKVARGELPNREVDVLPRVAPRAWNDRRHDRERIRWRRGEARRR